MALHLLLKLGDPGLYKVSSPVEEHEVGELISFTRDLHRIILDFRSVYKTGRAVAAPQVGALKRIICWNTGNPVTMINPVLSNLSLEMMEIWDDCMCFPGLFVKVKRHRSCTLTFRDEHWKEHQWELADDTSELIQHEVDHLDGILATQRAVDDKSFSLLPMRSN